MSAPSTFEYFRPRRIDEARSQLERADSRPLAGGTDLLAQSTSTPPAAVVVDLQALPLKQIERSEGRTVIGAMVTLQELVDEFDAFLAEAARREAPRQVRHAATVGGTIAAGHAESELVTALLALDAHVRLAGGEEVPLSAWMPERGEFITAVILPEEEGTTGSARVMRTPADRPIVLVSTFVALSEGAVATLRVAASGVAARPVRLFEVEKNLVGKPVDEALGDIGPLVEGSVNPRGDFRGSAEYRRAMAGILARRALSEALGEGAGK